MDAAVVPLLVLLLLAVAVLLRLHAPCVCCGKRRRRNHGPYPNPVLGGNVVPLIRNLHRFLD